MSLRPVREDWQTHQPEVVQHVTSVLRTHSHKVSCALADTALQRNKDRKRATPRVAQAELSTDSETGAASSTRRDKESVAVSELQSSDWEDDYEMDNARPVEERWGSAACSGRPVTDPRSLMSDELYVEIVKVLLDPRARLESSANNNPP